MHFHRQHIKEIYLIYTLTMSSWRIIYKIRSLVNPLMIFSLRLSEDTQMNKRWNGYNAFECFLRQLPIVHIDVIDPINYYQDVLYIDKCLKLYKGRWLQLIQLFIDAGYSGGLEHAPSEFIISFLLKYSGKPTVVTIIRTLMYHPLRVGALLMTFSSHNMTHLHPWNRRILGHIYSFIQNKRHPFSVK